MASAVETGGRERRGGLRGQGQATAAGVSATATAATAATASSSSSSSSSWRPPFPAPGFEGLHPLPPNDNNSNKDSSFDLDRPVASLQDKWRLIPHFLAVRSLLRQHIDSYDHFVSHELRDIVQSPSAREIRSDHDPKFFLRYEDVWVGHVPSLDDATDVAGGLGGGGMGFGFGMGGGGPSSSTLPGGGVGAFPSQSAPVTPFQCRLRDATYAAPLYATIRYTRGNQVVLKKNVIIGRMPVMLRSLPCVLRNKTHYQLSQLKECPYDPGGYFVVKGVEKAILVQEQLSKNRVILEDDHKGTLTASITSSTHERKSKSYVVLRHHRVTLRNNALGEDIPIAIILKAMGIESDSELVQLVAGSNHGSLVSALSPSLEEARKRGISTQWQALTYVGAKVRGRHSSSGGGGGNNASNTTTAPITAAPTNANTTRRYTPPSPQDEARDVLAHVVLAHVPVEHYDFRNKAVYVAYVVRRVLLVHLGHAPLDDKDYCGNKRLELAGNLLSLLFEDLFKIFNRDLKRQIDLVLSKPNRAQAFDAVKAIRPDTISHGLVNAIATGNWVLRRFRMDRAGVTQVLSRLSYLSALGMVTRINSQFEKTRKVSGPRSLQPSQWGMLCPSDTPEGEACGLVKNLALLAHITMDESDAQPLERLCFDLGVQDAASATGSELHSPSCHIVFLNGTLLGVHRDPPKLVDGLRWLRRRGCAGGFVSVYWNESQRSIHLATDGGRVCRPLLLVDPNTGLPKLQQRHIEALVLGALTIRDLLNEGIVEYVDCNEENNALIAVTERDLQVAVDAAGPTNSATGHNKPRPQYTHLEIDPFTILGVVGGVIPFPHHNQSPRNTYTVAMAKQAMGTIGLNQYERMDGLIYTLVYPQKPLVKSRTLDLVNFDDVPGGQNASIAVMSYSGYDIEDAVVLNKAAVDRGFGRCMVLRKHQTSVRRYANGTHDRTCGPPDAATASGESDKRYARYHAIDADGICRVGERLDPGHVICNKESPTDTTTSALGVDLGTGAHSLQPRDVQYKPAALTYRGGAPSYVDKVLITSNENEQFLVKVMLRQVRRPEIGDKFASRHGQKGVCGLIVREEDLPFNEYGHVPDLIMNPHGFPSRMTVGKLLELLVGKAGLFEGRQGYSTAFGEELGSADTAEWASAALQRHGLNYTGKDIFYSGTNGETLDAYVFSGPVFYQKLKHMVLDKAHARARGPRAVLTRQPTEGRSRDGGLRLGEMERDCLVAYGASNLIMERLMHSSDAFSASVCRACGLLQYQNWCQYCRSGETVVDIRLPYACKLLFQELQSMNVLPRLRLKEYG